MDWQVDARSEVKAVNYPRNTWWVAAFTKEITSEPTSRWLLDRRIVFYRKRDGQVVALDDRCPHRWAPLSMGKVVGDDIECPYHGITFDPNGHCVKIPSQQKIVPGCELRSYPVLESGAFVWIWMGDPERIAEYAAPCNTDWAMSDEWSVTTGAMEFEGNYMQLHENVLDLTHFGFVHLESLGATDWIDPPKTTTSPTGVTFRQEFIDRPLRPAHMAFTGTGPDRLADRFVTEGTWVSPAIHDATETLEFDEPVSGGRNKFTIKIVHAPTPISMDRYRYFYLFGWDVKAPPELVSAMKTGIEAMFLEDKEILQAIHETLNRDTRGTDYPEIKLRADTPQLHARIKLRELLERE